MMILVLGGVLLCTAALLAAAGVTRTRSFTGLVDVRVPVDDFAVGDFPMVCVRTGSVADGLVGFESDENGFQPWWLLLLVFGPLGMLAIVVMWVLTPQPPRVGGSLPMTRQVLADQRRRASRGIWALAVPFAAFAGGCLLLVVPGSEALPLDAYAVGLLFVGVFGGFIALGVLGVLRRRNSVRVRLDGSRRWVELRGVHPSFATEVNRQTRARLRAERERSGRRVG